MQRKRRDPFSVPYLTVVPKQWRPYEWVRLPARGVVLVEADHQVRCWVRAWPVNQALGSLLVAIGRLLQQAYPAAPSETLCDVVRRYLTDVWVTLPDPPEAEAVSALVAVDPAEPTTFVVPERGFVVWAQDAPDGALLHLFGAHRDPATMFGVVGYWVAWWYHAITAPKREVPAWQRELASQQRRDQLLQWWDQVWATLQPPAGGAGTPRR